MTFSLLLKSAALLYAIALCACSPGAEQPAQEQPVGADAVLQATIPAASAQAAGIRVLRAGPGPIAETLDLSGRIGFQPSARAEVRAPYSGVIRAVTRNFGDNVRRGDVLARVESSDSLQTYSVTAPISGSVLERNANVGEVSGDRALFVIADLSRLEAELYVFPRDAERVRAGQPVILQSDGGDSAIQTQLLSLVPAVEGNLTAMIARAPFQATSGALRPGMSVRARVVLAQEQAAIAVAAASVQRLGDGEVVFVQSGDLYRVRPIQIGRRSHDWVEVRAGLSAGEVYVAENAFIVKSHILSRAGAGADED